MNRRGALKIAGMLFLLLISSAAMVEVWLWRSGYGDFPLYDVNYEIGYIPRPNQSGSFSHKYAWYFNERSMRNEPFSPAGGNDILILGDSIVFGGGIDYRQADRLGACLQATMPYSRIWSVGAGSWSVLNELAYLKLNPEVAAGCEKIYWIVNWQDFGGRSQWESDYIHPRTRPAILLVYLAGKYARTKGWYPRDVAGSTYKLRIETKEALKMIPSVTSRKVVFIWFPTRAELMKRENPLALQNKELFFAVCGELGIVTRDIASEREWVPDLYRDNIHPSADGNYVLAKIIANFDTQ